MNEPQGIIPTAVYDAQQVCAVLQIGESKLQDLVTSGSLCTLNFTTRHRFFGQRLIEFCLRESEDTS
jgi:hypothetical protein